MQFSFTKNGTPTDYDKGLWQMVASTVNYPKVTPLFNESPYMKRQSELKRINEASERQAKNPNIEKVEKAVKYFEEKEKAFLGISLVDLTPPESSWSGMHNCHYNGSLGNGNKIITTRHPKIADCDY